MNFDIKTGAVVLACAFGAALLIAGLYILVYSRIVNRNLTRSRTRRMPSPRAVLMILLVISVAVSMCGFVHPDGDNGKDLLIRSFSCFGKNAAESEGSYLSVYNKYENTGYEKRPLITEGDFECAVFTSLDMTDSCHPYYLIFIDNPSLDAENMYYGYKSTAILSAPENGVFEFREFSSKAKDANGPLLFYGETTDTCVLELTVYYFDKASYDNAGYTDFHNALETAVTSVTFRVELEGWIELYSSDSI